MKEPQVEATRGAWGRVLARVALALDLLPSGVGVALGLVLGVALVVVASAAWLWVSALVVVAAVALGRSAGVRPRPAGWATPVAGSAVLLGLAGGMLGLGVWRWETEGPSLVMVDADGVEAMRLDLGDGGESTGGSTGGSEGTGATTGDAGSSTGQGSSSSGGDETTGGEAPPKPPRRRATPVVEAPADATTGGAQDEPAVAGSCPSGMTFIDGGSFDGHDIEPFCLDTTEVRVSSYERCMADGKCDEAGTESGFGGEYSKNDYCNRNNPGRGSHPINCVDWNQAVAFCAWAGKKLPTEWQWEWAARGRDEGMTYPWGEESPTCQRAVMHDGGDGCGKDRTSHVGSKPRGNSRDGVKDMAGNVWEWTKSGSGMRIVRGGSWDNDFPEYFRASDRDFVDDPTYRDDDVGFRCARTAGGTK